MSGDEAGEAAGVAEGVRKIQTEEPTERDVDPLCVYCPAVKSRIPVEHNCFNFRLTDRDTMGEDDLVLYDKPGFYKPERACKHASLFRMGQDGTLKKVVCSYPRD